MSFIFVIDPMTTVITLNKSKIDAVDISHMRDYVQWTKSSSQYFDKGCGDEHYKLLTYLAQQMGENAVLIDIGTYFGFSALALAANTDLNQKVVTYDIVDWIPDDENTPTMKNVNNIELKLMDCTNDMETILQSNLVMLDIDPHDGVEEVVILDALRKAGYQGLVVMDDIHLNGNMKRMWESIPEKKHDVTRLGHWSGTAIIVFGETLDIDLVE